MKFFSFVLILFLSFGVFIQGNEESTSDEVLEQEPVKMLVSSPNFKTNVVFPASPINEKAFKSGDIIDIVLGVTNTGKKTFNITSILASLRYPPDWRLFVQNFTHREYGLIVEPSEQISLVYSFRPDPMLEPRDFGLTAEVFYTDKDDNYTTVFFNETITLVETIEPFDAQALFTYVGILGIAGLIGFFVYNAAVGKATKKSKKSKIETGTRTTSQDSDDWLQGTFADPSLKKSSSFKKRK